MKKKLIILLVPIMLLLTCNRDVLNDNNSGNITINENGEVFMRYLKSSPNWEEEWSKVIDKGIPLANDALVNYIPEHGIHYLLPILSPDNIIHEFAIFPFEQTSNDDNINFVFNEPIFYDSKNIGSQSLPVDLIDYNMYESLVESGFSVDETFMPKNYQETISRANTHDRQYKFYYKQNGEKYSPWTKNESFLKRVLEVSTRICQTWNTKCAIIVEEKAITIRFTGIKNVPDNTFDLQVLQYMSQIEHYIDEVIIVPDKAHYIVEKIDPLDPILTPGIYVKDFSGIAPLVRFIKTSPPLEPIALEPSDPCSSMAVKMNSTEFKEELAKLKKLTTKGYETSSQFTYNSNGKYTFTRQDGLPGDAEVMMEVRAPIDGFIHTHYTHTLPTFSFDDLLVPYKLVQLHKIKNPKTFSMGLVTRYSTTFIFFDVQQYLAWARFCIQNPQKASLLFKSYFDIDKKMSSSEAIERLAKFLQQNNTGIILMEMGSNNLFKRIEVNSNGNVLRKKCNN